MATSTEQTQCVKCKKVKCTLRCGGCRQEFCFKHLADHQQELNQQLEKIEFDRDLFRQAITEQTKDLTHHPSIEQINRWKNESITSIRQAAEDARQSLIKRVTEGINLIEGKLTKLTDQLKNAREENDFNESNLRQFEKDLRQLTAELARPINVNPVQRDVTSYIKPIPTDMSSTTHEPIDEYSRRHIALIDKEVTDAIARIAAESRVQQRTLLADANARLALIEEEYKVKLQRYVEELDGVKAQNLSTLEKHLNLKQEMILEEARKRIDDVNEEASRLKMGVLREAQAQVNARN